MQVLRVRRYEFQSLRPQSRNRLGRIVEVDGKTVGLVVIFHIAENVVVDVAEEMDLGLHPPVVAGVGQGWVFVEHAAIPATHLVV